MKLILSRIYLHLIRIYYPLIVEFSALLFYHILTPHGAFFLFLWYTHIKNQDKRFYTILLKKYTIAWKCYKRKGSKMATKYRGNRIIYGSWLMDKKHFFLLRMLQMIFFHICMIFKKKILLNAKMNRKATLIMMFYHVQLINRQLGLHLQTEQKITGGPEMKTVWVMFILVHIPAFIRVMILFRCLLIMMISIRIAGS